jgi:uncharacterized protein YjeT (DUF2065 family)
VYSLRLFGLALIVLGVAFMGPLSTRGPAFRLRRGLAQASLPIEAFLTFRKWFVRFVGLMLVVGGLIYTAHPPAHLY